VLNISSNFDSSGIVTLQHQELSRRNAAGFFRIHSVLQKNNSGSLVDDLTLVFGTPSRGSEATSGLHRAEALVDQANGYGYQLGKFSSKLFSIVSGGGVTAAERDR
jgi:hypothetical protein